MLDARNRLSGSFAGNPTGRSRRAVGLSGMAPAGGR